MVDEIEIHIMDADDISEPDTCGDCSFRLGEECAGPAGSREGSAVYDDDLACDCFEPITNA